MHEFTHVLKEQSSVKVVLNKGEQELADATVSFEIAFEDSVAKEKPTHVLVIDIPFSVYEKTEEEIAKWIRQKGERRLYELSTIDYIQFHTPGKHNVLFVLLCNAHQGITERILQRGSLRSYYEYGIDIDEISNKTMLGHVAGYYESLIEIPETFFSIVPETGWKKYWWAWANRWWTTKPTDQCDFRKRAIVSVTIQPVIWFMGFLFRLLTCIVYDILSIVMFILALPFGGQLEYFMEDFSEMHWDFLFLWSMKGSTCWENMVGNIFGLFDKDEWLKYKHHKIGSYEFGLPISLVGLAIQGSCWTFFVREILLVWTKDNFGQGGGNLLLAIVVTIIGLCHAYYVMNTTPYKKAKEWWNDNDNGTALLFLIGVVVVLVSLISFIMLQIMWHTQDIANAATNTGHFVSHGGAQVGKFVWSQGIWAILLVLIIIPILWGKKIKNWVWWKRIQLDNWYRGSRLDVWMHKTYTDITAWREKRAKAKPVKKRDEWIPAPAKTIVNIAPNMVVPIVKKPIYLAFKVSFWTLKSKVCRPYAK